MTPATSGRSLLPEETSDSELVRRVLAGEQARFEELVQRYERPLKRLAMARGLSPEGAEEVVQETFLAAYRYLAGFDPRFAFRTWLWTILLNQIKRRLGQQARRNASEASGLLTLENLCDPSLAPETVAMQQESRQRMAELIQRLPDDLRDIVHLRYFVEATYPEIAEAQRCCLATAKNRVRAALDLLARQLDSAEPMK